MSDTTSVDEVLALVNFESPTLRTARAAEERLQLRLVEVTEQIASAESEAAASLVEATRMVKALLKSKLSQDAIVAALTHQFGQKRAPKPTAKRQSHVVSVETQQEIVDFVGQTPGCSVHAIRSQFDALSHQSIVKVLKAARDDGILRTEGNTRNTIYFVTD